MELSPWLRRLSLAPLLLAGCATLGNRPVAMATPPAATPPTLTGMGRAGVLVGLAGVMVSTVGVASAPAVPGRAPDLTGHITLGAMLVLLGTALAVEGERSHEPEPPPPEEEVMAVPTL